MYTQYVYWINENKYLHELYTYTVNTIISTISFISALSLSLYIYIYIYILYR